MRNASWKVFKALIKAQILLFFVEILASFFKAVISFNYWKFEEKNLHLKSQEYSKYLNHESPSITSAHNRHFHIISSRIRRIPLCVWMQTTHTIRQSKHSQFPFIKSQIANRTWWRRRKGIIYSARQLETVETRKKQVNWKREKRKIENWFFLMLEQVMTYQVHFSMHFYSCFRWKTSFLSISAKTLRD